MAVYRCRQACERASVCVSVRVHVCVFHRPCTTRPAPLLRPPPPPRTFSKPTARQCPLSAACALPPPPPPLCPSVCACQEKLPHWGTLYLVPSPLPAVLCYSHGGFSLAPSTIYLFPQGPQGQGFSGVPWGPPRPAWFHTHSSTP